MNFFVLEQPVDPCTPSPCGDNALCQRHQRERAATCACIQGYFGDPFLACRPECTQNPDCPRNRVCRNQKCVDPCPGLCGINAVCSISNHVPSCDCLQGYTGNPSVACNPSKKLKKHIYYNFLHFQFSNEGRPSKNLFFHKEYLSWWITCGSGNNYR